MSSGNNNSEILIKNVSFSYDNFQKKIIDGLNINIKKGCLGICYGVGMQE